MEVVQKDHWYFVNEAVTVRLEEGMVLSCVCPWDGNLSMVSWTKLPDKRPLAVYHPEFGMDFSHRYRERVDFLKSTPMDGSISMRNVTHQDIGLYHCSVQTFPQGPWTSNIQVEDLDEPPQEVEHEDHTQPPTTEVLEADTVLVAEQDNNLTLNCNHKHNGTVYQVNVERMVTGQPWGIIGVCKKVDWYLVGDDYNNRGRISCADRMHVSLHLTGVEEEDGGFYRCTFSTDAGVQTTTVLLTVLPKGYFSLSRYMIYIYIGGGAAGLILFIVILIVVVKHRKKNRREEYRVRLHPSQKQLNFYENIPVCPKIKRSKQINCPVYANLQSMRSHKTKQMEAVAEGVMEMWTVL
ncbi:hypothetical protein PAMP_011256 [Pampus punctatissimus]